MKLFLEETNKEKVEKLILERIKNIEKELNKKTDFSNNAKIKNKQNELKKLEEARNYIIIKNN